jgi:hypothetical protein
LNGNVVSSSACYTFTATTNETVVANFIQILYTINTGSSPPSGGTTSGEGAYNCGANVTVVAIPNPGFALVNWTENGNVVTNSTSYTFAASTNRTLVANFGLLPSTILADAGDLFDQSGNLAPTNSVAVLVVDTGTNGFVDPQPAFPLSLGATWGTEDRVVGLWDLSACQCGDGQLYDQTVVAYTNGIAPGQKLQLYWFPSLTLASKTLGVTVYGKYTDTNSPPLDGSDAWQMPAGGTNVHLKFWTTFWGGSNPESVGLATWYTGLTAYQSWQIQYFGSTNNAKAALSVDADGTGQNNLFKYVAGLDPTNPASVFVLTVAIAPNLLHWQNLLFNPVVGGRTYTPQLSTDLVSGIWMPLTTYVGPVTNDGNQVTITDTNAVWPQEFYRIDITYP